MQNVMYAIVCVLVAACGVSDSYTDVVDLGIVHQQQLATNWCWAAVGQMLGERAGAEDTQAEIVSYTFGRECTPGTCNAPNTPSKYLRSLGLQFYGPTTSDDEIRRQTDLGNPTLSVYRRGELSHMVLFGGYAPNGLLLFDPLKPAETYIPDVHSYCEGCELVQALFVSN